jgi:hypothetical protein
VVRPKELVREGITRRITLQRLIMSGTIERRGRDLYVVFSGVKVEACWLPYLQGDRL